MQNHSDDHERRLPPPIDESRFPNDVRNGLTQEKRPRAPFRAIVAKGNELRIALHQPLDWSDIHARFVDLWQEARLAIWRAKHHKAGIKEIDPQTGKQVLTFTVDERQVLAALDTTRAILDSIVKLRRTMGPADTGIPRWAVERIERALRNHPEAQRELLKELAAEHDPDEDD
jgi:hypothetical protein